MNAGLPSQRASTIVDTDQLRRDRPDIVAYLFALGRLKGADAARKEGRQAVFALLASLENAEEATYQAMKHGREPHDAYGPAAHEYASQLLEIFIAHNATP